MSENTAFSSLHT